MKKNSLPTNQDFAKAAKSQFSLFGVEFVAWNDGKSSFRIVPKPDRTKENVIIQSMKSNAFPKLVYYEFRSFKEIFSKLL